MTNVYNQWNVSVIMSSCKHIQNNIAIPNFLIFMHIYIDIILIHISNFNCYGCFYIHFVVVKLKLLYINLERSRRN